MTDIESTEEMSRSAVASYLHEFAAQVDTHDGTRRPIPGAVEPEAECVTFIVGDENARISPAETVV